MGCQAMCGVGLKYVFHNVYQCIKRLLDAIAAQKRIHSQTISPLPKMRQIS